MKLPELYVIRAEYAGDVSLNISFSNGVSKIVDFRPFFMNNPHPQHNRYLNPANFKSFTIDHGNVVWGKNWDMVFPVEQLYSGVIE